VVVACGIIELTQTTYYIFGAKGSKKFFEVPVLREQHEEI
jgi:hypothetical protein